MDEIDVASTPVASTTAISDMNRNQIMQVETKETNKINVEILDKTNRNIVFLSILEAIHIREQKPSINTKDEYIGRTLRITF